MNHHDVSPHPTPSDCPIRFATLRLELHLADAAALAVWIHILLKEPWVGFEFGTITAISFRLKSSHT